MPIIQQSTLQMSKPIDKVSTRSLVSRQDGTESLTVRELIIYPGAVGRLHTHPTDQVIIVTMGARQRSAGDEGQPGRSRTPPIAPPGSTPKLIKKLWVPATLLVIDSTCNLESNYLED